MGLLALPPELLDSIVAWAADEKASVVLDGIAVVALVRLKAACAEFAALVKPRQVRLFAQHQVASWEQLAISLALATCSTPDGGCRIGFEMASISLADEDGGSTEVEGSRARLDAFATILKRHPRAVACVDAHCGITAPPAIAHQFSVERARLVAQQLVARG